MKDEKAPLKTVLQNFINHVENLETRLEENDDLYESEFQELKNISDSLKSQKYYACTEGEKPVNRRKNRYKDILPFDVSRVVLSEFPGVAGSDYINANYIRGASGSPAYIASQGPLPHTVADFWRMAVECEVQVIVMACNQTEAGKHKCEHYVPDREDSEETFGDVVVTLSQSRQVCPDFTVKKLTVRYTGASGSREERLVCQFHYSAWPDHGVPSSVVPLLHMIRMLRDTQASETLPVLVHCSAGCGRTGTVCAIDHVWGLLKAGKLTPTFSLFDLVAEMRRQRIAMVQTKDQYMLVHRAVRQLFADQLRVIESHPYANVDSSGKVLQVEGGNRPVDTGDYEEICLPDEVSPSVRKRPAPSPPPQVKPPPRKNAPRHRSRPPPLPHKRKAPQPGEEPAAGGGDCSDGTRTTGDRDDGSLERHQPPAEPHYQGSLDRAEMGGRRASVGRLRQVFEGGQSTAPGAPRLARSKSSAALRCRPAGRPRTGSVSDGRDSAIVLYVPPAGPRDPPPAPTNSRSRPPPQLPTLTRVKSPAENHPTPRAVSPLRLRPVSCANSPPQVDPVIGAKSAPALPQPRPVAGARGSPLSGVTVNNVPAVPPVVRVVRRAGSPSARSTGRLVPLPDRRPVLPIKRSKSLKLPSAPLRVQRLGPAYLALENPPARQPAAVQPLYVNVPPPASGSPPRYVNIDLLQQYEEELVQRSRELGLNDTLTDEPAPLLSPALVTSASSEPRYANVPSPPAPRSGPPPAARRLAPPATNYPNCTPEARNNLRRIEAELQRNPRSGFCDVVGGSAAAPDDRPVPGSLGWHARQRRNSFRQAVQAGQPGRRGGNYEPIWVGDKCVSPEPQPAPQRSSLPPEVAPRPDRSTDAAADPTDSRPAVVPVTSYIVQGERRAGSPRLVGNSLFWSDTPAAVPPPPVKVTANSVFYSGTPSPPSRSTSLSVSENSAFKPYLPEKAASPNYATVYKQSNDCTSPLGGGGGPSRSDGARSADPADPAPVAPPRKRASTGVLLSRLSVSQPQLVGPSHLFLADIELDGIGAGVVGPGSGSAEERDSDTDSVPPAVPVKTQAAYQVPTPVRDVILQPAPATVRHRTGSPPAKARHRTASPLPQSSEAPGGAALGRSVSLSRPAVHLEPADRRPRDRTQPSESRPLDRTQPSDSRPLDRTQPSDSRPLDRTQPSDSRLLDRTQPSESRPLDRTQPSDRRLLDRTQPSESRPLDRTQPSESWPLDRTQPSESRPLDRTQPSESRPLDRAQPSDTRLLDRTQPSESRPLDRTPPSESRLLDRTQPSESRPLDRTQPSENRPLDRTQPSDSRPVDRTQPSDSRPLDRALGRLQATASSLRSRLSGRTEPAPPPPDRRPPAGVNAHSRQAYI